jgi:hypothetical protein
VFFFNRQNFTRHVISRRCKLRSQRSGTLSSLESGSRDRGYGGGLDTATRSNQLSIADTGLSAMTVKGRIRYNQMFMKHLKQTDNKNDKVSCLSMNQFIQELKRRKVFKVAAVHAVVPWMLIQVATAITPALQLLRDQAQ